jgi:electron transfer flavoprotein alpha subunit
MSAILVLVDHLEGEVSDLSYEMIGAARNIAGPLRAPVVAAVLGHDAGTVAAKCGGADVVLTVESASLDVPTIETTGTVLKQVMEQRQATIALIGGSNLAWGIGAKLAALTGMPYVNFCKGLKVESDAVLVTSQLYGGKILTDVALPQNRGIICVSPGSFPLEADKSACAPKIEAVAVRVPSPQVIFSKFIEPEVGDVDITKQDILVSVGRGIQSEENIAFAQELADVMGGAVSGSRPVVDLGWLPLSRQVGKSGMTVKPKLYLALGISGAPEHQEGIGGSQLVIAVNTDPKAPIFDTADYGTTLDLIDLLPALKDALVGRKAAK